MKILLAALFSLFAASSFADGKFYSDRIPADIPYQRAILSHDGGTELLLIESKFVAREGERFGWVVPVPAVPKFDAPDASSIDRLYARLEGRTRPVKVTTVDAVFLLLLIPLAVWVLYRLYLRIAHGKPIGWVLAVVAIFSVLAAVSFPAYQGIEMLKEERIGPYEAKVVRASSSSDMIDWLRESGFTFDERDRAVFDNYIRRGWMFATAKLDSGAKGAQARMVPPLLLQFASREATYPLALTGTGGHATEVLLYVFAHARMDAGGRLPLHYSDQWEGTPPLGGSLKWTAPIYLTKFRGQIAPDQMRLDLELKPAPSNASYRRWEFGP